MSVRNLKITTVYLPEPDLVEVKAIARISKRSEAAIFREALAFYLKARRMGKRTTVREADE